MCYCVLQGIVRTVSVVPGAEQAFERIDGILQRNYRLAPAQRFQLRPVSEAEVLRGVHLQTDLPLVVFLVGSPGAGVRHSVYALHMLYPSIA